MFERFSSGARQTVIHASGESARAAHGVVDDVHLLLGLLNEPDDSAGGVLRDHGASLADLRARVQDLPIPAVAPPRRGVLRLPLRSGHRPFTPAAKRSLAGALHVAVGRRERSIGSCHVLISLLDTEDGAARRLLTDAGVDVRALRTAAERRLGATQGD
ncbi:Clp protease N-terminal domain-containing protein [Marinactinospora rubrisoli]|uniref:Clp protease N-terminal domain-containing protein n=1 Tax=Marinactinospora rubrisoli TaxID=2715399 RepID=A0ABW2KB75_9ACTN